MSRESADQYVNGRLMNGYDYDNQAWVLHGKYVACGHPGNMDCKCYGRIHAGEETPTFDYNKAHEFSFMYEGEMYYLFHESQKSQNALVSVIQEALEHFGDIHKVIKWLVDTEGFMELKCLNN